MRVALFIVICLLAATHSQTSAIVKVYDAKPREVPYQISFQAVRGNGSKHLCSGSIIDKQWVLTAASCLFLIAESEDPVYVVTGRINILVPGKAEQRVGIADVIEHNMYKVPGYSGSYDIALIKLVSPLELNEVVQAVALPEAYSEPSGILVVSGWGSIAYNEKEPRPKKLGVLQSAEVSIVDSKVCDKYARSNFDGNNKINVKKLVHEANLCVSPVMTPSGVDDIGNPLIAENKEGKVEIIGIQSWTFYTDRGAHMVFVKVSGFVEWIEKNTAI